jgi:tRNA pseudouridine38-40 synthase
MSPPFLLRLAYVGAALHGCTDHPGRRTVPGELRAALGRLGLAGAQLDVLSRTDAGVHAWDQHVTLTPPRPISAGALLRGLAHQLPPDVRPLAIAELQRAPAVRSKTYVYLIDRSRWGDPALAWCAWRAPAGVDLPRLRDALVRLRGAHDWEGFRRRGDTRDDLTRELTACEVDATPDLLRLQFEGPGFTYHLARSLVGAAVAVARGVSDVSQLDLALAGEAAPVARQQAPAHGLHLVRLRLVSPPAWIEELEGALVPGPWSPR